MPKTKSDQPCVLNRVSGLVALLIVGTISIFTASAIRDLFESVLQLSTPTTEKAISGGSLIVAYRFFFFLMILALLVLVAIVLVG
jgi:hypothetical protein